jgi:hypothetical protein
LRSFAVNRALSGVRAMTNLDNHFAAFFMVGSWVCFQATYWHGYAEDFLFMCTLLLQCAYTLVFFFPVKCISVFYPYVYKHQIGADWIRIGTLTGITAHTGFMS